MANQDYDFRTVSSKITQAEFSLFKDYCEKKGLKPSGLIKELILRELKIPIPHIIAGKNRIYYDKENDRFTWSVAIDTGEEINILKNVAPAFLEDMLDMFAKGLKERASFISKTKKDSVPVPSNILRMKR